jgi:MFS family permease
VIGAPVLGYISDRTGRRKPALFAGMVLMLATAVAILYLPANTFPPYVLGLLLGIGSCRDDPLYDHQGSESGQGQGQRDRSDQFPRLRRTSP